MFIPLRKVDAAQRLVFGQLDETPDRSGEVFDYATSKPHFEAWSGDMYKGSDGKSFGNVRAMHGRVAAGKLDSINFDDVAKRIEFCAHIVDEDEWAKVEAGVYTGFSPGGKYLKRWKDGNVTRYTARPSEISIVDFPCIPSATFTLVKADGSEERPFKTLAGDDLRKSLYDVKRLSDLLDSLQWLGQSAAIEAQTEQDGSTIPMKLRDWLTAGASILSDMATEEASEAVAALSAIVSKLPAPTPDMQLAAGLSGDDLAKATTELASTKDQLAKVQGDLTIAKDDLTKLTGEKDQLAKRVAELEALPKSGGPVLKTLGKGEDVNTPTDGDVTSGTFEERLAKVNAMPPGGERRNALAKLSRDFPSNLT